jgi:hypothetical protein
MRQLSVVSLQTPLAAGKPSVVLRCGETGAVYGLTLSQHQARMLETASCQCSGVGGALEALAGAFGARLEAIRVDLRAKGGPTATLVVAGPSGLALQPVGVNAIEGLAIALRYGLPIYDESGRGDEAAADLPAGIKAFIDGLNTDGL